MSTITLEHPRRDDLAEGWGDTAPGWDPAEDNYNPRIPASYDEGDVAAALAEHLEDRWLYVADWNRWLRWDGTRWAEDRTEQIHEVARLWAIELVATLGRTGAADETVRAAARYRNRSRLESTVTMARRIDAIAASPDQFDTNPDLLNVANGIVDLRTAELHPHDPLERMTKLAPTDYIANDDPYHSDLGQLMNIVDRGAVPWLRRFLGYAATGHTSEDAIAVFDGSGSNGKTTLLETVGSVLGDYAGAVSPKLIMSGREEHPAIKADLMGKRFVWISETAEGGAFRMEQVKALTGGDQISARFMRGNFFTFTPTHTLVLATNHRPKVNSSDYAAWRRLRLLPFPYTYKPSGEERSGDRVQDPDLRRRLVEKPLQRQALLTLIVNGAKEWYEHGLGTCAVVSEATRHWRASEDVIMQFASDCLHLDPDSSVSGSDLYAAYKKWCADRSRSAQSNAQFIAGLTTHDEITITKVNHSGRARYRGLEIRATE